MEKETAPPQAEEFLLRILDCKELKGLAESDKRLVKAALLRWLGGQLEEEATRWKALLTQTMNAAEHERKMALRVHAAVQRTNELITASRLPPSVVLLRQTADDTRVERITKMEKNVETIVDKLVRYSDEREDCIIALNDTGNGQAAGAPGVEKDTAIDGLKLSGVLRDAVENLQQSIRRLTANNKRLAAENKTLRESLLERTNRCRELKLQLTSRSNNAQHNDEAKASQPIAAVQAPVKNDLHDEDDVETQPGKTAKNIAEAIISDIPPPMRKDRTETTPKMNNSNSTILSASHNDPVEFNAERLPTADEVVSPGQIEEEPDQEQEQESKPLQLNLALPNSNSNSNEENCHEMLTDNEEEVVEEEEDPDETSLRVDILSSDEIGSKSTKPSYLLKTDLTMDSVSHSVNDHRYHIHQQLQLKKQQQDQHEQQKKQLQLLQHQQQILHKQQQLQKHQQQQAQKQELLQQQEQQKQQLQPQQSLILRPQQQQQQLLPYNEEYNRFRNNRKFARVVNPSSEDESRKTSRTQQSRMGNQTTLPTSVTPIIPPQSTTPRLPVIVPYESPRRVGLSRETTGRAVEYIRSQVMTFANRLQVAQHEMESCQTEVARMHQAIAFPTIDRVSVPDRRHEAIYRFRNPATVSMIQLQPIGPYGGVEEDGRGGGDTRRSLAAEYRPDKRRKLRRAM